uniref:Uncharacterized protein n=1 Tax=Glossina austeni TaxID=7395 RepID=A0A1A9VFG2_GLOAU
MTNYKAFTACLKTQHVAGVHNFQDKEGVTESLKLCPLLSSLGKDVNSVIFCIANHHSPNCHGYETETKDQGCLYNNEQQQQQQQQQLTTTWREVKFSKNIY